ncbi:S8 family serine peptidase [Actinomadura yumaensis]|uniref:S8 family peptidase n=1 Tax=Actinomadura TaxID=1988 RepID=UPI001323FC2F|nr:S8 family serine peptidase [Actinomadura sp. J1-007]MWK32833.1 S8 family serine peptidase [Actinomadura sp. J1-007]
MTLSRTKALTAAALLAAGALGAVAAPPAGGAAAAPTAGGRGVALITGDVVRYGAARGGAVVERSRPGIGYRVTRTGSDVYVVPSDAQRLVASGAVDRELFNVSRLVSEGYGDTATPLPVIVDYRAKGRDATAGALKARATGLPGGRPARVLDGLDAVAFRVDRGERGAAWSGLVAHGTLRAGARRLILDARVRATLDQSVPQIGAPTAWQAGYDGTGVRIAVLDTGIQAHPDIDGTLADPIDENTRSFVAGEDDILDHNGHGTHVAATALGQGLGGTPARKGVAPGAKLIAGKVLGANGTGLTSDAIAGMRWAAQDRHADVVSMSLGTPEGTAAARLMEQTVDELSASTGSLFVVAAGNEGEDGPRTLDSPGTAASALTVGAVDKSDKLAWFSSRGPRRRDDGVKPDVSAPGVGIVAARAEGTSAGTPVDANYTSMNGTSMATPHVAGAAAIMRQRRPGWTAAQIKAALVGSSKDIGRNAYETGAGRIQVDKAIEQTVLASPAALDFGRSAADGPEALTKTLTYANTGAAPVTLDLSASFTGPDGAPLPSGDVRLSTGSLTVPAGGSAQASLTVTAGPRGLYAGRVTATGGGRTVRTAAGLRKSGPDRTVTFNAVDGAGQRLGQDETLTVFSLDDPLVDWATYTLNGGGALTLPEGAYAFSLMGPATNEPARDGMVPKRLLAVQPEVRVAGDTTVTFDVRAMDPVTVSAPEPGQEAVVTDAWHRVAGDGRRYEITESNADPAEVYVLPTPQVTNGSFALGLQTQLVRPQAIFETGQVRAEARYQDIDREGPEHGLPKLEMFPAGKSQVTMVAAGDGSAAELAKAPVRGSVAVVQRPTGDAAAAADLGRRLADAGAKGAVVFDSRDGYETARDGLAGGVSLPVTGVTRADGLRLLQAIGSAPAQVTLDSAPRSPYVYNAAKFWKGQVPSDPSISLRADNVVAIDTSYPSSGTGLFRQANMVAPADAYFDPYTVGYGFWGPVRRTEYYPADPDLRWQRAVLPEGSAPWSRWDRFTEPGRRRETRGRAPFRLGQLARTAEPDTVAQGGPGPTPLFLARRGDTLYPAPHLVSGDGHDEYNGPVVGDIGQWPDGRVVTSSLTRDGTAVPSRAQGPMTVYDVPQGRGRYAFRLVYDSDLPGFEGYKVDTTWGFDSERPTGQNVPAGYICGVWGTAGSGDCEAAPAVLLDYDIPLDLNGRATAPARLPVTIGAHHQPGAPAPALTSARISFSYNGTLWQTVTATANPDGTYTAALNLAAPDASHSTVHLRVQAADADGNTVDQTITKAFTTRAP